jgi:hypothetical protein
MLPAALLGASLVLVPSAASAQPSPTSILPPTADDPLHLVDQVVKGLIHTSANPGSPSVINPSVDLSQPPMVGDLPVDVPLG